MNKYSCVHCGEGRAGGLFFLFSVEFWTQRRPPSPFPAWTPLNSLSRPLPFHHTDIPNNNMCTFRPISLFLLTFWFHLYETRKIKFSGDRDPDRGLALDSSRTKDAHIFNNKHARFADYEAKKKQFYSFNIFGHARTTVSLSLKMTGNITDSWTDPTAVYSKVCCCSTYNRHYVKM